MDMYKQAEKLAKRPYLLMTSVDESTEDQPICFARVLEMDGCFGQGESREQAIEDLKLAMVDFIVSLLEDGLPVPEPTVLVHTAETTSRNATTFNFIGQGKKLLQKPLDIYPDAYVFSSQIS